MIKVTLTEMEMEIAGKVGCARRTESKCKGRNDNKQTVNGDTWALDIEGAAAEMSFCKAVGIYWPASVNSFHGPDCGKTLQIRSTPLVDGRLRIGIKDNPDHHYILVIGIAPHFEVHGYAVGRDVMQSYNLENPNNKTPVYMVPREDLTHIT